MQRRSAALLQVVRQPETLAELTAEDLGAVLRGLAKAGLLAHLGRQLQAREMLSKLPSAVQDRFEASLVFAADNERRLRLGMHLAGRALGQADMPVVVLKGGAYLLEGFPNAAGRLSSDLDLMVPKDRLAEAEALLHRAGWISKPEDSYEDHYYRAWMHELPPLLHPHHDITLDLHHTISPPSGRLKLDANKLFDQAVPLPDGSPFLRLCDEDLVLHLCVHSFHDGEFHSGLRELVDLDGVLRVLEKKAGFWNRLIARAAELALVRPLYYGSHFAGRLMATPVPSEVHRYLAIAAPLPPARWLVEWAMEKALLPDLRDRPSWPRRLAESVILVRAHWLRMPPLMLLQHLFAQVRRRGGLKTKEAAARTAR